jgi:hypothetical protein
VRRILFARALGDDTAYREACRQLVERYDLAHASPQAANAIAWSCALGPGGIGDYDPLVRLSERATASWPATNRLNTLGAILYRAGRVEEAVRQLDRSVAAHGAGGTPYDALFLAMAHHRLGHHQEARDWLRRGTAPAPVAMMKPDVSGDSAWIPRLELDILRREALTMLGPEAP